MLLHRAGLTASAGLSCFQSLSTGIGEAYFPSFIVTHSQRNVMELRECCPLVTHFA